MKYKLFLLISTINLSFQMRVNLLNINSYNFTNFKIIKTPNPEFVLGISYHIISKSLLISLHADFAWQLYAFLEQSVIVKFLELHTFCILCAPNKSYS